MPFNQQFIVDPFGRPLEYLRLSVTDRCNLRCFYCMPSENMNFLPRKELLSFEEMELLVKIFESIGVKKIRITGGEPFVRKDLMILLRKVHENHPSLKLAVTSNGVLLGKFLQELEELEIKHINLSLDTLNPGRFLRITGRDDFDKVYQCLFDLLERGFEVKLNCVMMKGVNEEELIPFAELTREFPVSVRFIEEMPFNGVGKQRGFLSQKEIQKTLEEQFGTLEFEALEKGNSSVDAKISGFAGSVGIIPAFTRNFCGQCNRIRVSATGKIKTCLYGTDVLDLKKLLNSELEAQAIKNQIIATYQSRPKDGFEAEEELKSTSHWASMSEIGG